MVYEEGCGNAIYDDEDMEDGAEPSESELNVDLEGGWDGGLLSKEDIMFFWKRLQDVVLPTGIPGMPSNLGYAKAGSLKVSQWHSLFTFIIPVIVVELYVADDVEEFKNNTNRGQILLNIANIVQCTNIVCAKKVLEFEAKTFQTCYRRYHNTSKKNQDGPYCFQPSIRFAYTRANDVLGTLVFGGRILWWKIDRGTTENTNKQTSR